MKHQCEGCIFAEWEHEPSGRKSRTGDGKCSYPLEKNAPTSFHLEIAGKPFINRVRNIPAAPCPTRKERHRAAPVAKPSITDAFAYLRKHDL